MNPRSVLAAVALVTIGCSTEDPNTSQSTHSIADSSGVTVVTNDSGAWATESTWEVSETPILEIGATDGEKAYLFKHIHGALRLPDGSIVAADETEVRLFDDEGNVIRTEGRRGEGPGEYQYIRAIKACQPGYFNVFDRSWEQSTYTLDGEFVQTERVLPDGMRPYTLRCTPAGTYVNLLWSPTTLELPIGLYGTESSLIVGDAEVGIDTVMTVSGGQRLGSNSASRPHPFGTVTAIGALGERMVISTGEAFEYRVYDLQGELIRIVRMPTRDRTIQQEDIDAYARQEAQRLPSEFFNTIFEENRSMEMTDRFPAYSDVLIDDANFVWLGHHVRPLDATRRWDITDADGVLLGSMEFDKDLVIEQIGRDFILGHHTSDDGVPQVVMWSLTRGQEYAPE